MAIITLSRQIGSLGNDIAERVAAETGYKVISMFEIHKILSAYGHDYSQELRFLTAETEPEYFDQIYSTRSVYFNLLCSMIYNFASRDRVIIKGRGGYFLFQGNPYALNVRITAPVDTRVANLQALRPDLNISREYINDKDEGQAGFLHYIFQEEISRSDLFDIIINTGRYHIEQASRMLVDSIRFIEQENAIPQEYLDSLSNLALAKRVEAYIHKENPSMTHITVSPISEGVIRLSGYLYSNSDKIEAEKYAAGETGVTSVVNDIIVYEPHNR